MSAPTIPTILQDAAEGRATLMTWTAEEYQTAVSNGFLAEDPAYELLDGLIVRKERNAVGEDPLTIGDRHRLVVRRLIRLDPRFEPFGCFLQTQDPVSLPPRHVPEPDGAVVRGRDEDYADHPPAAADVLCVIEVSDASLRRDRTSKLKAYAAAGIPLYVIVNLVDDQAELYTLDASAGGYAPPRVLKPGDVLHLPTAAGPTVDVAVNELLVLPSR